MALSCGEQCGAHEIGTPKGGWAKFSKNHPYSIHDGLSPKAMEFVRKSSSDVVYGWCPTQLNMSFAAQLSSRLPTPGCRSPMLIDSTHRIGRIHRGGDGQIKGSFISWWRWNVVTISPLPYREQLSFSSPLRHLI